MFQPENLNDEALLKAPKLRAILVGYGGMGKDWCTLLSNHPDAELVGVVELRAEARARAVAEQGLSAGVVCDSLPAVLACTDADFIIDCTPPFAHKSNAQYALAKGLHVMGEGPIAPTVPDAAEVVASAHAAGKVYMANQNYRWHPMVRALHAFIQGGTLGPLQTVNVLYAQNHLFTDTFRYHMEHPLLLDMTIHHFDTVRYMTGTNAVSVYGVESRPANSPFKGGSTASAVYTLAGGAVFTYQGSWSDTGRQTDRMGKWRIVCDRGVITWNGAELPMLEGETLTDDERHAFILSMVTAADKGGQFLTGQLGASLDLFIAAVRQGDQPEMNGDDAMHTLAMVLGAIESSATGQPVKL